MKEGKKENMATKPGILTDWPWGFLGKYKLVLVPLMEHAEVTLYKTEPENRDYYGLLFPFYLLLSRLIHNQLWITLSRFQNARSKHQILFKSIEFQQVDRERNWDDQAIMHSLFIYVSMLLLPEAKHLPFWNTTGALLMILIHIGPVEFLYYWVHRALHHHFLYTRYHSHHHSSFVTEPITSVVHPFAEHLMYALIFTLPILTPAYVGAFSLGAVGAYITLVDTMNNVGHCNFEFVPAWVFRTFPFLKYLVYTPTFHSLHHSQVNTNFSLFMPLYDFMYGTMDKTSDTLYEMSTIGREEKVDVVHLTHPTSFNSIYQIRIGFAYLASQPYASKWYLWMMWPVTFVLMLLIWLFNCTFTVEKNHLSKLKMQVWAIPRYSFHYLFESQKKPINTLIEKAILEAESRGTQVLSLGLLNQGEELNKYGELYVQNHEKMKIRLVDGSALAAAVVLNTIPKLASQVLIAGCITKTCYLVAIELCKKGCQVIVQRPDEYKKLNMKIPQVFRECLVRPSSSNRYKCKNWLPRRVMSAWRVAGIVHALEGWEWHECGDTLLDVNKVWSSALSHGFKPFPFDNNHITISDD